MGLKFLKDQRTAVILTVLSVLAITVGNVNYHLDRRAAAAAAAWEERQGARAQLKDRCSYASQLYGLCRSHDELSAQCEALRRDYNLLYESMEQGDSSAMAEANAALTVSARAAGDAFLALPGVEQGDRDYAERYLSYMDNAARLLQDSRYNALCADYARLCEEPWLRALSALIFVDAPLSVGA